MADVPAGTGLGSSGSFIVALLTALHALQRENLSTQELAEEACLIEIDKVGQPVGKQDQYLAAFGGVTYLEIAQDGCVKVNALNIEEQDLGELRNNILLFYTGVQRRDLGILVQQNRDTNKGNEGVIASLHTAKEIGLQIKEALERDNFMTADVAKSFGLIDEVVEKRS